MESQRVASEIAQLEEDGERQERLDQQGQHLKGKLAARYGQDLAAAGDTAEGLPQARGRQLAHYAISLFDTFLAANAQAKPAHNNAEHRNEFTQMILGAMDKGFEEASSVYGGIEQLDPKLAIQVKQTFADARQRLAAFQAEHSPGGESPSAS